MRVRIELNGSRITKKEAAELIGKERLEERIKDAKEGYYEDPFQTASWMDGMEIIVTE
jgi:hypothetical protein